MKARHLIIASVVVLVVVCGLWLLGKRKPSTQADPSSHVATATPSPMQNATPFAAPLPDVMPKGPYQGMSDPRWPIYWKKREQDRKFEWNRPIEFYGKVVDQNEQPIPNVEVSLNWTDISPKGTSDAIKMTDADGKFSITGIQGKNFGVRSLKKDGYVEALKSNPHSFEYAGFWEPTYHEPDPNNPVIFHMKKKGESAPLVSFEGKFVLTFGTPSPIPMPHAAEAVSPVRVAVFENDAKTRKSRAQVSVDGGGIMPALEEFPFEAPKEGYQSSIDLNQESPRSPGWQDMDEGGWFYIKTAQGYGLLKLRQMRGKRTLHYQVLLNSKGGTNLEPAQP